MGCQGPPGITLDRPKRRRRAQERRKSDRPLLSGDEEITNYLISRERAGLFLKEQSRGFDIYYVMSYSLAKRKFA
jgi:hypothetical protein